jgi:hypothetical protein
LVHTKSEYGRPLIVLLKNYALNMQIGG